MQQSLAVPRHHSESGIKHRHFASGEVSTPPAQAVRTTALRPTQPATLAGSTPSAGACGGGWLGGKRSNEVMALQNHQSQMRGGQQSKSPQIARYVRQRHQQQQQMTYHSQHDAMPQRNPNYHIRSQRLQQHREHHRSPRHQQLPRHRQPWSSNFRDGRGQYDPAPRFSNPSNRAGEVDQDVHRRRDFQHDRNMSGDQARVNYAMRRNTGGSEGQDHGGENSKRDGAREYKKRERGEAEPEPESSAGEDNSGKGGGAGNTKRTRISRWGPVECDPLRSPSHSASLPHHSSPDPAGSLFAATREFPHPSDPRVFYADSISSNVPKAFRVGTEVAHQRAASAVVSTPGSAVGNETETVAKAATDVSVETNFLPGPPLLSPRPGPVGGATVLTSNPSPWQSSFENISSGSASKKKNKRKKKKKSELASGQVGSGRFRTDDDATKFGEGPPEFLAETTSQPPLARLTPSAMGLDEQIPTFHGVDFTVPASAASHQGVAAAGCVLNLTSASPNSASTGSTIADQLYFAAAQAKAKALQLRKEATKAYRQAAKAARMAEAELKCAEARAAGGVTAAAAAAAPGQVCGVNSLSSFAAFLHDHDAGTKGKGKGGYAESDFSDPGDFSEDGETPPVRCGVFPPEGTDSASGENPRGDGVDAAGYVETPSPLEKKEGQRAPPSPPIANRYDVSSSEGGYADTDSDCGVSPRAGDPVNAADSGTPAVAINEEKYKKAPSINQPAVSRYDVSSSEDEAQGSGEQNKGRGDGKGGMQVYSWGRYDVSSSSSALYDVEGSDDTFKRNNNLNSRGATGVALLQSPPPLQPCPTPPARYDVSSTSSAASTTPATSPHSSPSGRYDVSSSDSNDDGAQQQRRRLQKNRKRRMRRNRRQVSSENKMLLSPPAMDPQPSPEWLLSSPPSSPSEACSDGYGSGFDSEEYKRFFEPKLPVSGGDGRCPGGSGGLGLPHPLGLKIVQGGGGRNAIGEAGLPDVDRSSNGCGNGSQRDLEVGAAPPNDEAWPAGSGVEKARPQHQVSVVVPSSADFKWEKVNLKDPLSLHKSLLDRLAGIGKPLPNFSGPCSVIFVVFVFF